MPKNFTLRDLPKSERPRERLLKLGPSALSGQELLALIIGRGVAGRPVTTVAQELLSKFGNIKGINEATVEQLCEIKGIGKAKAAQLIACFEIAERGKVLSEVKKYEVKSPENLVNIIRASIKDKAKEHFKLVILDSRNRIITITNISTGTVNANLVHSREVFADAIRHNAVSIILAHNHPSGEPEPSVDDIKITQQLVKAGEFMGIKILDHIIISEKSFVSFKRRKLI